MVMALGGAVVSARQLSGSNVITRVDVEHSRHWDVTEASTATLVGILKTENDTDGLLTPKSHRRNLDRLSPSSRPHFTK